MHSIEKSSLAFAGETILALGSDQSLPEILQAWAQAVVNDLDATFARVWTVSLTGTGLELQANAARDTPIAGKYAHIPVGGSPGTSLRNAGPTPPTTWSTIPGWAIRSGPHERL